MTWSSLLRRLLAVGICVTLFDLAVGQLVLPLFAPTRAPVFRAGQCNLDHAYGNMRSAALSPAEVWIMGSSRASAHYDDELLSRRLKKQVYNAGAPGMGVMQARATWALANPDRRVKLVILDAVFIETERDLIRRLEPWLGTAPVVEEIVLRGDWKEELKTTSRAYRCGGSLFVLVEDYGLPGQRYGYQSHKGVLTTDLPFEAEPETGGRPVPDWFAEQLEKFITEVQSAGAELVMVESPAWRSESADAAGAGMRELYRKLAEKHGLPFWCLNLRELPRLADARYFSNIYHLNQQGSQIFTDALAVKLLDSGLIDKLP
jgi:hypothetical protein